MRDTFQMKSEAIGQMNGTRGVIKHIFFRTPQGPNASALADAVPAIEPPPPRPPCTSSLLVFHVSEFLMLH